MKGNHCPVSGVHVDSNCARLTSLLIFIFMLIFLLKLYPLIITFLCIDYILRATGIAKSPLVYLSEYILSSLKIAPKKTDGAPKLFAARIGLTCCIIILFATLFHILTVAYIVSMALIFCTFLESMLNYCVGCKIYSLIKSTSLFN